jgi:hypothetical protein
VNIVGGGKRSRIKLGLHFPVKPISKLIEIVSCLLPSKGYGVMVKDKLCLFINLCNCP